MVSFPHMNKINILENVRDILSAYLMPEDHKTSILEVDFDFLQSKGFTTLLIDIDNTLVERKYSFPEWKMKQLIDDLKTKKWTVVLLSNNRKLPRVLRIVDFLEVNCIYKALKPFPWVYKKIFKENFTEASKTICIGDQLFMDILGGNIVGCRTIYVDPLGAEESRFRIGYIWLERYLLKIFENVL